MERIRINMHRGKLVVVVPWPDGIKSRIRVTSEEKGRELKLRAEFAIFEGSWQTLRSSLLESKKIKSISGRLNEIADEYFNNWVLARNKSVECKRTFLRRFKKLFGQLPIRALSVRQVDRYVLDRKNDEVKNSSINRELACLRHLFEWAISRGYVEKNPLARYEKLEEQEWAGEAAASEVIEAVFSKLDPVARPVFVLIRETGARRGEVLGLERWQVNWERREILFAKRTKSSKNRLVPISDRAMEALDSIPPLEGCPYVFYDPATRTRWKTLRSQWETAREEAGYPWLTPKHLRPAFATDLSERGLETEMVSDLLGHSSIAVTERFYIKRRQQTACRRALEVLQGHKIAVGT